MFDYIKQFFKENKMNILVTTTDALTVVNPIAGTVLDGLGKIIGMQEKEGITQEEILNFFKQCPEKIIKYQNMEIDELKIVMNTLKNARNTEIQRIESKKGDWLNKHIVDIITINILGLFMLCVVANTFYGKEIAGYVWGAVGSSMAGLLTYYYNDTHQKNLFNIDVKNK